MYDSNDEVTALLTHCHETTNRRTERHHLGLVMVFWLLVSLSVSQLLVTEIVKSRH